MGRTGTHHLGQRLRSAVALAALLTATGACAQTAPTARPTAAAPTLASEPWNDRLLRRDAAFYRSPAARVIADSVLQYQSAEGGWPKNTDLATPPAAPIDEGRKNTFDNGATTTPMIYLAHVYAATGDARYRAAFDRGLAYTLAAQYPNGGWPQFYPLRAGYYSHVTFNDDAMARILRVLRDIGSGQPPFAFVEPAQRAAATAAVDRGIDVILKTQIRLNGRLAGWCAQHDEVTLQPAWARKYEPPSLSGGESVGIVRFLMEIDRPSPAVIAAVEGGVEWLRSAALRGVRVEEFTNAEGVRDKRVVSDAAAPPLWARFYELGTSRPIFLGRDSVVHYTFAEIEHERRNGYNYYGSWAEKLLREDYPRWKAKHLKPAV